MTFYPSVVICPDTREHRALAQKLCDSSTKLGEIVFLTEQELKLLPDLKVWPERFSE